jgi:hypothetical protein
VCFEALIASRCYPESCLSTWRVSALGLPLLKELLTHLQSTGVNDLQTTACILTISGPIAVEAGFAQMEINRILFAYAYTLQSWGAHVESCLIFKFIPPEAFAAAFNDMEFVFDQGRVCNRLSEKRCQHFVQEPFCCSVCQTRVTTIGIHCPDCGHGGHVEHLKDWFAANLDCPTGCGCICGTRFSTYDEDASVEVELMPFASLDQ